MGEAEEAASSPREAQLQPQPNLGPAWPQATPGPPHFLAPELPVPNDTDATIYAPQARVRQLEDSIEHDDLPHRHAPALSLTKPLVSCNFTTITTPRGYPSVSGSYCDMNPLRETAGTDCPCFTCTKTRNCTSICTKGATAGGEPYSAARYAGPRVNLMNVGNPMAPRVGNQTCDAGAIRKVF